MDTEVPQCMGRTTKGRRCRLRGIHASNCYGVEIPVCGHHSTQNAIHNWSRYTFDDHVPPLIKRYLDFYEQCVYVHGFKKVPAVSITTELFRDSPLDIEAPDIVTGFLEKVLAPDETNGECSVCMENVPFNMCALHCNHAFCYPCIVSWVFTNPTCPLCRKNISMNIK